MKQLTPLAISALLLLTACGQTESAPDNQTALPPPTMQEERQAMYYNARHSGTIDTIPDTPGLAVWKPGHIGVYIGNGEVIEAMGTKYGVVKTQLQGRGWTHWLEIPYIAYE